MDRREDVKSYYPGDCGKDKREDSGNYYPGGTVVPQGKVPGGQENFVQKQEKLEVKTNTIADLREAVKELAKAMGATVVSAFAAMAAFSAEVHTAKLEKIDLDAGVVVTNVTFEGLATTADLDDKRDKTDLTVYVEDKTKPMFPPDALPVTWGDETGHKIELSHHGDGEYILRTGVNGIHIANFYPDGTLRSVDPTTRFGGKPGIDGQWPKLIFDGAVPTADTLSKKSETFPAADGRQLAAQVSAQGALLNAEDARFVSTNYDSKVRLPEAYFEIKLPSGEWARIWSEMTRWNWFLEGIYSPWTNAVAAALSTKGEKEWGFFDAATGAPAPDGFLWLSMPRIAICAGAAYQRIAEAQGSYWVLESNGMVAELSGNTNGYFRIVDDEGKPQFEIVKGDKMTVYAAPSTFTSSIMGVTHYHVTYKVQNAAEAPKAEFKRNLPDEGWLREGEAGCPCNVSWTKRDDSTYECEWWPIGNEPSMFMQAAFQVGGETRIVQTAPVEMQRIVIGGKTYTLTVSEINGKKVLTLDE